MGGSRSAANTALLLPRRLQLPSGKFALLSDVAARDVPRSEKGDLYSRALSILAAPKVLQLSEVGLLQLTLADFHTLIACLLRAGLLHEPRLPVVCDNCHRMSKVDAASSFEWGPFVDGELSDPELDRPFDWKRQFVFGAARSRCSASVEPRTVADIVPLLSSGAADGRFRIRPSTPFVLSLLGFASKQPKRMHKAFRRMGSRRLGRLSALWFEAHFPARLSGPHLCSCGATTLVRLPQASLLDVLGREFGHEPPALPADFPTLAEFEKIVRAAKRTIFSRHGIASLRLVVDEDVPAVDEGGIPLLGSYTPHGDPLSEPAEIRLYYRSFQHEAGLDPRFPLEAEVFETIEHEVLHHLSFLRGEDPVDEEERFVIAKDRERRIGRKELLRRERSGSRALIALAPLLLVILLAAVLDHFAQGR